MMANQNDSDILKQLTALADAEKVDQAPAFLWANRDNIEDDSAYWQTVAATWIKCGTVKNAHIFRELFLSKRRNRHKLMKKGDRRKWRSLPNRIQAYRAVNPNEDSKAMFSYTIDPSVLFRVYKDSRNILERAFQKRDVIAYFNRRGEHEIIAIERQK